MKSRTLRIAAGLLASSCLTFGLTSSVAHADDWTDSTGARTIQADFVKLDGVQLTLRKADGKEITLPLHKLDDKSRIRARAIARAVAKGEARPDASGVGGGSLSTSIGGGAASSSYQGGTVIPEGLTAQQFNDFIQTEIRSKRNYGILLDAFPPSYQKDINDIFQLAISKFDQAALTDVKKVRDLLVNTLREKKSMLLASNVLPIDPTMKPLITQAYDPVLATVPELIPDSLLDYSRLTKTPLRDLIGPYADNVSRKMEGLGQYIPMIQDAIDKSMNPANGSKFEQVTEDTAVQITEFPGVPPIRVEWVKVEGRWVNKQLRDTWGQQIAQAKAAIDGPTQPLSSLNIRKQVSAISLGIGILANAETQEDVDDILNKLMSTAGLMAPMLGGGFGPPPTGP